jgi:hypothetical protein
MAPRFLINGTVSDGMFPDERLLTIGDFAGLSVSFLIGVDRLQILPDGNAQVEVREIGRKADTVLIRLPGEPLGSSTVSVDASTLLPA